ncbi:MAG: choice-of-anchor Q domain-containing protein, partial [Rubripirellula sp.]
MVNSIHGGVDPDPNSLSLAEAISQANSDSCINDTIEFDTTVFDPTESGSPQAITLEQALPTLTRAVNIVGPGSRLLTIDAGKGADPDAAGDGFRILTIDDGTAEVLLTETTKISGLTLTGGDPSIADRAGGGGAIFNTDQLELTEVVVHDNQAIGGGGGIDNSGLLEVFDSTISGNTAVTGSGGGILNNFVTGVTRSTLSDNQALLQGGGIATTAGADSETRITTSTISGNRSTTNVGGGIHNDGALTDIRFSTITNNSVIVDVFGGGISSTASSNTETVIRQSIVAGNINSDIALTGGDGTNSIGSGGFNLLGNVIGDEARELLLDAGDVVDVADPMLDPLADNGGITQTHALLPDSPAENNGMIADELSDQRGFPRDDGEGIDIGAFERSSQSIVVTTANDEFDFINDDISLREAIELANQRRAENTSITFLTDAGGAFETEQTITLNSELPVMRSEALSITGPGADRLTIVAASDSRILTITEGDDANLNVVQLAGMTLTGGSPDSSDRGGDGGAIHSTEILLLDGLVIRGNQTNGADSNGGGVFQRFGSLSVLNSTVDGNTAGGDGGGIHFRDDLLSGSALALIRSKVTDNRAIDTNSRGGGVFIEGPSTVINAEVSGNTSSGRGGGLYTSVGQTSIESSVIDGNQALASDGGGIFNGSGGELIVGNTTVSGSRAVGSGGGIRTEFSKLTVSQSTISGNTAGINGGGISSSTSGSVITLVDTSTVSGNVATTGGGGGVFNEFGTTRVIASTVTLNSAPDALGGGLATLGTNSASTVVQSSIVAENQAQDIAIIPSLGAQPFESLGSNLIGTAAPLQDPLSAFNGPLDGVNVIDPGLGPLANNGGRTRTHLPDADSSALNRGSLGSIVNNDQRGQLRDDGSGPDVGAVERGGIKLLVTTTVDELDFTNSDLSLREAIDVINRAGIALGSSGGSDASPSNQIAFGNAFQGGGTIELTMGELVVTQSVEASDSDALVTIDAGGQSRVLRIDAGDGVVFLAGFEFTGGNAVDGAGILLESGNLLLAASKISGNTATGSGGGISTTSGGVAVRYSTIDSNSAGIDGGGIHSTGGKIEIFVSTISNNTSSEGGGGIFTEGNSDIFLSTISGNQAAAFGGGILAFGDVDVASSTIVNNTSEGGGGISVSSASTGALTITNSIVAKNRATSGFGSDFEPSTIGSLSVQASLIGNNQGTTLAPAPISDPDSNGNLVGTPLAPIDPRLTPLGNFGGPGQTHHPLIDSPALQRGQSSLEPEITIDQRLLPRNQTDAPEMGSVEFQSAILVGNAEDELDDDISTNDLSLREAIAQANASPDFDVIVIGPNIERIDLILGELVISESVLIAAIEGQVTIDAGGLSRVIQA